MNVDPTLLSALQRFHDQQQASRTSSQAKLGNLTGASRRVIFLPTSGFLTRSRSTSNAKSQRKPSYTPKEKEAANMQVILSAETRDEENASQLFSHIKEYSFFLTVNSKHPSFNFNEASFIKLCQKLKYEKQSYDKVVYEEGDTSNGRVYLIYSGEVGVYKRTGASTRQETPQASTSFSEDNLKPNSMRVEPTPKIMQKAILKKQCRINDNSFNKHLSQEVLDKVIDYGELHLRLKSGDFFGEQALLDFETRSHTVRTFGPCELLVLTRRDFYFIRENHDEKRKKVCRFIQDFIPQMENSSSRQLLDGLICTIEEKTLDRGSFVTSEGENSDTFYIIFDGTCEIIKNIRIDESSNLKESLVSIKQLLRVGPVHTEALTVCTAQKGAFIGDEIIYTSEQGYNFSVRVCSSTATIFVFNKAKFLEKFPSMVQEELLKRYKMKNKHYAHVIRSNIEKKYPQLEPAIPAEFGDNQRKIDSWFVTGQLILIPTKNFEINKVKAGVGLLKGGRFDLGSNVSEFSPEKVKRHLHGRGVTITEFGNFDGGNKASGNRNIKERESPMMKQLALKKMFVDHTEDIHHYSNTPDAFTTKNGILDELESMMVKMSRTHIQNDQARRISYLNSSPVPKNRNLTDRGPTIKLTTLATDNSVSSRTFRDQRGPNACNDRDQEDFSQYTQYLQTSQETENFEPRENNTSKAEVRTNKENRILRADSISKPRKTLRLDTVVRGNTEQILTDPGFEIDREIRDILIGDYGNSKEYVMARKRHTSKSSTKVNPKREDGGTIGKRLTVLLKPLYKDKSQNLEPMSVTTAKTINDWNLSQSPNTSQLKKRMPSSLFITKSHSTLANEEVQSARAGNFKSIHLKQNDEILTVDEMLNSTESPRIDMSQRTLQSSRSHVGLLASESARKAKNDRKMAMLRYKYRKSRETSSNPKGVEIKETRLSKDELERPPQVKGSKSFVLNGMFGVEKMTISSVKHNQRLHI